ncbi:MAG: TetR/AcrR family transcriptional regulator [Verrucomicrobiota bacterium JB025]|nr:TetR/AcrR family transcriptional regulator [Verrucomicrobiota bacterium JB025]
MSQEVTKERILDAAEELMINRSFHSVGLAQILAAVKVTKGAFYYHFESKEQFGVEMLKHYANNSAQKKQALLLSTESTENPIERLLSFFEMMINTTLENDFKPPCLIHKLATEVADFSDAMRREVAAALDHTISVFTQTLDEAVAKKLLPPHLNTQEEAALILDLWNGALLRALAHRDASPLRKAVSAMHRQLHSC